MLTRHPLSAAFPELSDEEFTALKESIRRNGQRDKILLVDDQILDGWHRYRACLELGKAPIFGVFTGDAVQCVIDKNIHRRQLTASQRAMALAACNRWLDVGANQLCPQGDSTVGMSIRKMAAAAKVNPKTIEKAKRVALRATPELRAQVIAGATTLAEAVRALDSEGAKTTKPRPVVKTSVSAKVHQELEHRYIKLQDDYQEMGDNYQVLAEDVEALYALKDHAEFDLIKQLQFSVKNLTEARDKWQNEAAEKQKQINYFKGRLADKDGEIAALKRRLESHASA
jgi:myosin heavy subunit